MTTSAILPRLSMPCLAPRSEVGTAASASDTKPNVDWWTVGDSRYNTTADLVKSFQPGKAGQPATYHWRQETTFGAPQIRKARMDSFKAAVGVGAALGLLSGVFLNVAGAFGTVITAGMMAFPGVSVLAATLVGAAAGAGMAGLNFGISSLTGWKCEEDENARAAFESGHMIDGQLQTDAQQHVGFYVNGRLSDKVDLNEYANAKPGAPTDQTWWKNAGSYTASAYR